MTPLPTIDRKDLDHDEEYLVDDEYKQLGL
jgi:hypothetical protein